MKFPILMDENLNGNTMQASVIASDGFPNPPSSQVTQPTSPNHHLSSNPEIKHTPFPTQQQPAMQQQPQMQPMMTRMPQQHQMGMNSSENQI